MWFHRERHTDHAQTQGAEKPPWRPVSSCRQRSTGCRCRCHRSKSGGSGRVRRHVYSGAFPHRPRSRCLGFEPLVFDEEFQPLPANGYPDFILVRRGEQIRRLAKFDPWVLQKLVSEAGLSLDTDLAKVPRGLF